MASSYREGRPRTSIAWEHFEIKDKDRGVATCNHCHQSFSYRTSISNLMKHLKGKHGYTVVKGDGETGDDETDCENEEKTEPKQKLKNEVWEYFQAKDLENKQASCTLCLEQLSYEDTLRSLYDHLKDKHTIDFSKDDEVEFEDDDDDEDKSTQESRGRSKSSVAWEYFEVKDEHRKVGMCKLCGALCSYRTSVSNLMKHVRRKHGGGRGSDDDAQDDGQLDVSSYSGGMSRSQRSIVWLYFKCVDPTTKLSQCLICKKMLSHSTTLTNLKKHLARKHPNVKIPAREDGRKRILLSSGGELYEVDAGTKLELDTDNEDQQNDTVEMDTVYLDDFDALEDDQPLTNFKQSKNKRKRVRTKSTSSSEEEITFINRYKKKQSDSFDHFGKYMASLLRKLPKEMSSQLQSSFVKQILEAEKGSETPDFVSNDLVK